MSGPGIVRNGTFVGLGSGISRTTEMGPLGGVPGDITVVGSTLIDVNPRPLSRRSVPKATMHSARMACRRSIAGDHRQHGRLRDAFRASHRGRRVRARLASTGIVAICLETHSRLLPEWWQIAAKGRAARGE
ncbi:MAG: hypothetical protein ACKO1M_14540 [Planctomycetota bacterium]